MAICGHIHDQCSPSAQVSRYGRVYLRGAWEALWVYIQTRLAHTRSFPLLKEEMHIGAGREVEAGDDCLGCTRDRVDQTHRVLSGGAQ
jgi:hypothetical protein